MGRYVITGGNSGIGLEIARGLVSKGHDVVLLGRSQQKNDAAAGGLGAKAKALAVDLSTNQGVREAAKQLGDGPIDGLVHSAGMLTLKDERTADDLHPVFAVNYLSRYHLTQLLRPQLRAAPTPTVIVIVAGVPLDTKLDFSQFPRFKPFPGMGALSQIQIANHYWASVFAKEEPRVKIALCNVGLVKTEIMRAMPLPFRIGFTVLTPVIGVSVHKAAANPLQLATSEGWASGSYFPKPGRTEVSQPVKVDDATAQKVVAESKELTGV